MTKNRLGDIDTHFWEKSEILLIAVTKYTFQEDEYHIDSYLWLSTVNKKCSFLLRNIQLLPRGN